MRNKKLTKQIIKRSELFALLSVICYLLSVLTSCENTVENGYGRISISFAAEEQAARTVWPLLNFDKYTYIFTKTGETNGVEKKADNAGLFLLEIGSYTVKVQAYIGAAEPYTLAASGVSGQFSVGPGINAPVEVRLSYITGGTEGKFSYTIMYPESAAVEITLQKFPELDDVALAPVTVTGGNGITQALQLETGSYLLTVLARKDQLFAGTSEVVHIYPLFSTVYTKEFIDNNFIAAAPITSAGITVAAPAKGAIPGTSASGSSAGVNFTIGPVSWLPENSVFLGNTVYTATLTLTANTGYTFNGLGAASINGQNALKTNNTGTTVTLSYAFPLLEDKTVTGIAAIKTQPDKLTYTHGDPLDLSGLVVTLSYDDLSTGDVAAADFSIKGLSANPAQGAIMVRSTHDGQPVTITYNGLPPLATENLTVRPKVIVFTVDPIPAQTYTGNPVQPALTVKDGTTILTANVDYTAAYTNNTNQGTAAVTLSGVGNYAGSTGGAAFTISLTVTAFDINGGTGTVPAVQMTNNPGNIITLPDNSGFSRTGYTFDGWNTLADGKGTNYNADDSYTPAGSITLYARWLCTVTFNTNGATGTTPAVQTVPAGSAITLPGQSGFNKSGTFDGWNTNASGTGTTYKAGASYTPAGNTTLYASWVCVITYDRNNSAFGAPYTETVIAGSSIKISSPSSGVVGLTFDGWCVNSSGAGATYRAGESFTPIGNITLYARWLCTVTYNANGGSGETASQTVLAGSAITLPNGSGFYYSSYLIAGWSVNSDGTGNVLNTGASYTPTRSVTLYARWGYKVTFDINGGTGTAPPVQYALLNGSSVSGITLPNGTGFSKPGYTFRDWTTSPGAGTNYLAGSSYTPRTSSVTLYARWSN